MAKKKDKEVKPVVKQAETPAKRKGIKGGSR